MLGKGNEGTNWANEYQDQKSGDVDVDINQELPSLARELAVAQKTNEQLLREKAELKSQVKALQKQVREVSKNFQTERERRQKSAKFTKDLGVHFTGDADYSQLKQKMETLKTKLAFASTQLKTSQADISLLQDAKNVLHNKNNSLRQYNENLSYTNDVLCQDKSALSKQLKESNREKEDLNRQIGDVQATNRSLEAEKSSLLSKIQDLEYQHGALKKVNEKLLSDNAHNISAMEVFQKQLAELQNKVTAYKSRETDLNKRENQLKIDQAQIISERIQLNSDKSSFANTTAGECAQAKKEAAEAKARSEEAVKQANAREIEAKTKITGAEQKEREANKRIADAEGKVKALNNRLQQSQDNNSALSFDLKGANQKNQSLRNFLSTAMNVAMPLSNGAPYDVLNAKYSVQTQNGQELSLTPLQMTFVQLENLLKESIQQQKDQEITKINSKNQKNLEGARFWNFIYGICGGLLACTAILGAAVIFRDSNAVKHAISYTFGYSLSGVEKLMSGGSAIYR